MKIRIFALANELNVDSKELIEACAKVGIVLKPSALASISPEDRDKVVAYLKQARGPAAAPAPKAAPKPAAPKPAAPKPVATPQAPPPLQRESLPARSVAGKVPELRNLAPRPQNSRFATRDKSGTAVAEAPAETIAESTTIAREIESEQHLPPVVDSPPEAVEAEVMEESPAVAVAAPETSEVIPPAVDVPTASVSIPAESPLSPSLVDTPEAAPQAAEQASSIAATSPATPGLPPTAPRRERLGPGPLRRDDYISASGVSSRFVGSRDQGGDQPAKPKKPKSKPGPALPVLPELGKFKAPVTPKQGEAPAQKPEIRLPADVLSSPRPLESILRKNAEDKEKRKKKPSPIDVTAELTEETPATTRSGRPVAKPGGAGLTASRRDRQEGRTKRVPRAGEEEEGRSDVRIRVPKRGSKRSSHVAPAKSSAVIETPISVRSLSEAIGRPASVLLRSLFVGRGMQATINSSLDEDTALELALECGVDLQFRRPRDIESELSAVLDAEEDPDTLVLRPPIVTILGHVDHGKTTLLDTIRSANVAAGEAGGITQHIAAYQVERDGHQITFVDTPGHAAFGEMRARGANVTDIVVLVVAADDGVMPQTVEAISHARAAGVPIVVAMNKCDLPGRNEQRVLQELSANNVLPVEWGGDVEVVRTSGLTGLGIDDLLETLLVTAELHELKSSFAPPAHGVCLEAFRDEGRGVLAWLIVQKGTLNVGDMILCGEAYGRVRAMYNDKDDEIASAGPSTPVMIAGLDVMPGAGDKFFTMADQEAARLGAEDRRHRGRTKALSDRGRPRTLEDILDPTKSGQIRDLPLIVKADTPGSIEAIKHELGKFSHPEVRVKIMHDGVGGVNESDVYLAAAGQAIIVAFHVVPEDRARMLAEREGVEVREYQIIYELTDHIKQALEGLLRPEIRQVSTGRALVLKTFSISRFGTIAGCRVLSGTIERSNRVRLIREQRILNEYSIASLKREKDDAKEVRDGMECGIRLDGFNDIKEGDLLEAFRVEEIKRTL